jgi:tetrahydromethanopterin S-methyltransferase subunit D
MGGVAMCEREPEPYVHADMAVGEVLVPCSCDVVAVGGALEPCRSTAVGAVGSLLTSPCFCRGLRTAVVMEHAGCHHYMFTGASQIGRRSCSP